MPDSDSQETEKHKRGRLEVRGGQPLAFIEDSTAAELVTEPSPELREAISQVIATLKAYRGAVKNLLSGKYADLRGFAPNHLREPCDITAICCRNGIIVRYDLGKEGSTKIRGAAIEGTLTELAPKFSDSLLHFPLDRGTYDPSQDGIKLEMTKVNFQTGAMEPISTIQFVMLAGLQFDPGIAIPPPPSRPLCLVSLTNELHLVMSGVVVPADPKSTGNIDKTREFVAQGTVRLQVAWQALEVYPAFQPQYWRPEFAPLWAENDLLAAVARHQSSRAQLAAIDPNLAARRAFKALLDELAQLLDGPEEPAHQFLKQHPEIISPTHTAAWSKLPLGNRVTDFVFREPSYEYVLVEIESPLRELFRKDGQQREELTHAFNQIIDWRVFIEDNPQKVEEIGLVHMSPNPRSLIVIGRSSGLTEENRRKLATLQGQIPKLRILTYDELIQTSKAMAENLFGPLDITGDNVEILYPLPKPDTT
jgi:hypothetical protein